MKLKTKLILSSSFVFLTTCILAALIQDNGTVLFKCLMALSSILILAAGTALGAAASFAASWTVFTISRAVEALIYQKIVISPETRQKFFRWFHLIFFLLSWGVVAKFSFDFAFAQIVGSYIFLCGAIGFSHGTLVMKFCNDKKMIKEQEL